MPLVKRVISTNIDASGNPLRSIPVQHRDPGTLPFLIRPNRECVPATSTTLVEEWDVLVLDDTGDPLPDVPEVPARTLEQNVDVVWLYHDLDSTLAQKNKLEALVAAGLNVVNWTCLPFNHITSFYNKYLEPVRKLASAENAELYKAHLLDLDRVLFGAQTSDKVIEFLLQWALIYALPDRERNDQICDAFDKMRDDLVQELRLHYPELDRGLFSRVSGANFFSTEAEFEKQHREVKDGLRKVLSPA